MSFQTEGRAVSATAASSCAFCSRFVVSCIPSWFWGPIVTLEDCLAAFFAADELKGALGGGSFAPPPFPALPALKTGRGIREDP